MKTEYLIVEDGTDFCVVQKRPLIYFRTRNEAERFALKHSKREAAEFYAVLGPNTNQWWAYSDKKNVYVDIPKDVLEKISDCSSEEAEDILNDILAENPEWLNDLDFTYSEIEI